MLRRQTPWRRLNCSRPRRSSTASHSQQQLKGHEQPPTPVPKSIFAPQTPESIFAPLASKLQASLSASQESQDGSSRFPPRTPKVPKPHSIDPSALALYWDTLPPSPAQLNYAHNFFHSQPPTLLFSASRFLTIPFTSVPEVAFLGRSNVGKSSLLNALFATTICKTSKKPGRTKTMNAFSMGSASAGKYGLLNVLDMPGYGNGSNDAWGNEIMRYLKARKELKRVFVLVDSVHWLKSSDKYLLYQLAEARVPYQVVLSKIDRLMFPKKVRPPLSYERLELRKVSMGDKLKDLRTELMEKKRRADGMLPAFGQVLGVAASSGRYRYLGEGRLGALGVDALRWSVLQAAGLAPARETFEGRRKKENGKEGKEKGKERVEEPEETKVKGPDSGNQGIQKPNP